MTSTENTFSFLLKIEGQPLIILNLTFWGNWIYTDDFFFVADLGHSFCVSVTTPAVFQVWEKTRNSFFLIKNIIPSSALQVVF